MKKFTVESHEIIYYKTEVWAEDQEEAMDKVLSWDFSLYDVKPVARDDIGATEIDDVYEIDNEYYGQE
jgi:hypothetical protein